MRIKGYPGSVGLKRLCPIMLDDGPDALQFIKDCFTEVGWHANFESFCQLDGYFYDPVTGCDVRVGDAFVLVEHRRQCSCGPGVLHLHYP